MDLLVVLGAFIALKAKNYYVAPIYPMLFAAGAIGLERMAAGRRDRDMDTWRLCRAGDCGGRIADAIVCSATLAGELYPL